MTCVFFRMEKDHKVALKKNRLLLATDLIGDEVFQYLVEKKILNDFMVESIESKSTVFKKNVSQLINKRVISL